MRWLDSVTEAMNMNLVDFGSYWRMGGLACCMESRRVRNNLLTKHQQHAYMTAKYMCI